MINQIMNLFSQQQALTPINGVQPKQAQSFKGLIPEEASKSLAQKYGSPLLDTTAFQGATDNFSRGLSLMPEGALGKEGAVDGQKGGKLNVFA
jgi:hypothetical protein